jgi:2,3-bisphosphoglycerate-dependent phosphoglycerate mutase
MAAPTLPSSADRRRRRRLRLIPIIGYTIASLGLAYFLDQQQSTTVIFVRHAETDSAMPTDDPPLSARGRQRAELLADFMEDIDVVSGVNAIYASDQRGTQETAAPLAKRLNVPVQIADHHDTGGFMDDVLDDHHGEIVLVVSHADTIAPLIDELHGSKRLAPFGPNDFNRVYIVTTPWYGKVKTLLVHYSEPPPDALEVTQSADPTVVSGGGQ